MRKISPRSEWMMLIVRAHSGQLKKALEQVEDILRRQRNVKYDEKNNFDLNTADRFIEQFDSITAMVGLVAIALSSVGLLVGGIGVMNIMLVSVTERTFEVGLRKAVGATRRQILMQFLIESGILCALGGVIGLLISWGITTAITMLASITMTITIGYIILALGVSTIVGMIAGIYPAFKAARLDPILALTKA
jgi:putative ABC transport system permease protein